MHREQSVVNVTFYRYISCKFQTEILSKLLIKRDNLGENATTFADQLSQQSLFQSDPLQENQKAQ